MAKGLGHLSKIGLEMDMVYEKCLVFQRDFLDFLKKKIKADTYLVAAGADAMRSSTLLANLFTNCANCMVILFFKKR